MARTVITCNAEDLGSSGRLEAEGIFLFKVDAIHDGLLSDGKTPMSSPGLGLKLSVAMGEHAGKSLSTTMVDANPSHKDGGLSASKKQCAFFLATDLATPDQLDGGVMQIEESNAVGRFLYLETKMGEPNRSGKQYLEIHFDNIWHIDDPRVASQPRDEELFGLLPANLRHDAAYFEKVAGKRAGSSKPRNVVPDAPTALDESMTAGI